MGKIDDHRRALERLDDWEPYLLDNSGLPGPRGNIELAQAAADLGTREQFEGFLAWDAERAPVGTREEFLAFCGTVGLGKLAAAGDTRVVARLRALASDPRWRVREGVAMALQRIGIANMPLLLAELRAWADGNHYEQRAAAAGLCEPVLLKSEATARSVLELLDRITSSLARSRDRRSNGFRVLRQGLAYCWSVAVAAAPDEGRRLMERWMREDDQDVR